MVNRKQGPALASIDQINLPDPVFHHLDNGIEVCEIRAGEQEVIRLEFIFDAGRIAEKKKLAGRATSTLLKEGTRSYSSAQIAEIFDHLGSGIALPSNLDSVNFVVVILEKHLKKVLPVIKELFTCPLFQEKDLKSYVQRQVQRLQVELSKNDVIAYRKVTELIFGKDHPYGYNSFPETYHSLNTDDLHQHFESFYTASNCRIFLSGKTNAEHVAWLNEYFGRDIPAGTPAATNLASPMTSSGYYEMVHPDKVQSAIRIGRRLFTKKHADFFGFYFLNTILGGYFSSRLMSNIREEKGYTYNIYSSAETMNVDGYWCIGAEVGKEFEKPAMEAIFEELDKLRTEPVEKDELEMVRNYLIGSFLSMVDGPFNIAETIKSLVTENLSTRFFQEWIHSTQTIEAEELMHLAQQYFTADDFVQVLVKS